MTILKAKKSELKDANSLPSTEIDKIVLLNPLTKFLLIFAGLTLLFSFIAPALFNRAAFSKFFSFSNSAEIGNLIGGVMSPIAAVAGVIVTGLAFYIQYRANLLQRQIFLSEQAESTKQFQQQINNQNNQVAVQQFESHFFEMLKSHRQIVSEITVDGYTFNENLTEKYTRTIVGRKLFSEMENEFNFLLFAFQTQNEIDANDFNHAYRIFFNGLGEFVSPILPEGFGKKILYIADKHEHPGTNNVMSNYDRTERNMLQVSYRPFAGHSTIISHYLRNLFLIVKTVVNSEVIASYKDKMKYLKILRAQLSNAEQTLLFYNWLSGFGSKWENDKNHFFTEYLMIHNLWPHKLFQSNYISQSIKKLSKQPVQLRKGPMFEIEEG